MQSYPLTKPLRNWCGRSILGSPRDVHEPQTEAWAHALIQSETGTGPLRLLGNRYSWPALIDVNDATVVQANGLSQVHEIADDAIDVAAGARLAEVGSVLRAVGKRLACSPPVIAGQTVAGAIATGTHGQGLGQSTVSDIVTSARIARLDGRLMEVTDRDEDFGAYRHHLGCLGLYTRLTLAVVPNVVYTCEKVAIDYEGLRSSYMRLNESYEFCKAWWFPGDDCAHLWLARPATRDEQRAFEQNDDRPVEWGDRQTDLNSIVNTTIQRISLSTKTGDLRRPQFRTVLRFRGFQDVTGYLDDILCQGIPAPQVNCEIGVDLDQVPAVLDELRSWYRRRSPRIDYPVILRATGPSEGWLCPAYDRRTCYLGFVLYQAQDGSVPPDSLTALDEAQALLSAAGGRPHWGKYFAPRVFDLASLDRWDDFHRVRRQLDPDGRLLSEFLYAAFGEVAT